MYIDKDKHTNHIVDKEKKIEIRKVLDKAEIVLNNHITQTTDFLDPYETYLAKSVLNSFTDIKYLVKGGYDESERKIIIIYPEYIFKEDIEVSITSLNITGDLKGIEHKDYLGSILSLGINRNKLGDILVYEDHGLVIAKKEITDFILYNLEKIKNKNVKSSIFSTEDIIPPELNYKIRKEFLSSLRLDTIISSVFNLSRKDSLSLINSGDVKVNFEEIDKPSREIEQGDMISVKKLGRFILYKTFGKSKSGRIICEIRIIL